MSFLETIEKARAFLERNERVSLRVLQREFELDTEDLDVLIEELVDVQRVAIRDGGTLALAAGTKPAGEVAAAGATTLRPFLQQSQAELAGGVGESAERARLLREAQSGFEAIGAPLRAGQAGE
jgi:hypothetical protein